MPVTWTEASEAAMLEKRAGGKGAWKARRSRMTAVSAAVRCWSCSAAWRARQDEARGEGLCNDALLGRPEAHEETRQTWRECRRAKKDLDRKSVV